MTKFAQDSSHHLQVASCALEHLDAHVATEYPNTAIHRIHVLKIAPSRAKHHPHEDMGRHNATSPMPDVHVRFGLTHQLDQTS